MDELTLIAIIGNRCTSMNRVVVLLKDEELANVKKRAGLIPLSAWFRDLAMGGEPRKAGTGDSGDHPRPDLGQPASAEMPTPPKPSKKRGKHFTDTW